MTDVCPHCGVSLPGKVDAFCPDCRNSLDDPPPSPATPSQQLATQESGQASALQFIGWLLVAGAIFSATMGSSGIDALESFLALLAGGAILLGRAANHAARARKLKRQ